MNQLSTPRNQIIQALHALSPARLETPQGGWTQKLPDSDDGPGGNALHVLVSVAHHEQWSDAVSYWKCQHLLDQGVNPLGTIGYTNLTPLHFAVWNPCPGAALCLAHHGRSILYALNAQGQTPLEQLRDIRSVIRYAPTVQNQLLLVEEILSSEDQRTVLIEQFEFLGRLNTSSTDKTDQGRL